MYAHICTREFPADHLLLQQHYKLLATAAATTNIRHKSQYPYRHFK